MRRLLLVLVRSHTPPKMVENTFFVIFADLLVISRSWFAHVLQGIRDLSSLLIWELPKLYLPTINFYFILLMPLFFWSHTCVCSASGRRFYALYTEIWHQDWLRIGCVNSMHICYLYYACIQAGACNLIVYGIDGLSLPPPTAPRPNHRTPGTSTLL